MDNLLAGKSQHRLLKRLGEKKHREAEGLFLVENDTIVMDGLKEGIIFRSFFSSPEYREKYHDHYEKIRRLAPDAEYYDLSEKQIAEASKLSKASGMIAVYPLLKQGIGDSPSLYLNAISDPGNLGTIMRAMLAFGFHNLIVDETCVDIYNPKTISAAKDAIFKIDISHDKELAYLKSIKGKMPIITTELEAKTDLDDYECPTDFCLVMGSEAHGISPAIRALCEQSLRIDISPRIESLNVAIAASIFLYRFRRDTKKAI